MIVLDTDHLSCLEWGSAESASLRARLAEASDREILVSIASYEEQIRGWMALLAKLRMLKNRLRLIRDSLSICSFTALFHSWISPSLRLTNSLNFDAIKSASAPWI